MRLLAYTDYVYRRHGSVVYADRAFSIFLEQVGAECDGLTIVGRLSLDEGTGHYPLGSDVRFVDLPHYRRLVDVGASVRAMVRSIGIYARAIRDVDAVWLLGPHPLAIPFAAIAALRGRRVALGVRQDTPAYLRARYPGRRLIHVAADALDASFRVMARRAPVVVVGPDLAERYARSAPRLLEIAVSLIRSEDLVDGETAAERSYDDELTLLSVGRLETEKNPLLLADALARLRALDPRWRLLVCGEGPLEQQLRERLEELGLTEWTDFRGYVPLRPDLLELYRESHALVHVSLTEGLPQVLLEAFASRLPVVATAVGGVARAAGDAALLVPPRDSAAIADAVDRIARDAELRQLLTDKGAELMSERTVEAEAGRVARFIDDPNDGAGDVPPRPR